LVERTELASDGPDGADSRGGGDAMPSVWGLSKEQANYRDAPSPAVQCKVCKFMFPPLAIGSCRFVRGVIEGSKTCDEFAPRKSGQTQS
jgi:hypothetical protein